MMKKISGILTALTLFALGAMMIFYSEDVSAAVIEAVKSCVYRIVPSLFGVSVLATALSGSGALPYLLKNSAVDGNVLTAFILGNVGGYPVGAKLLAESSEPGTASDALVFCYSAGPAFAAGIVGTGVFGNRIYGLGALLSVFLANLSMYLLFLIRHHDKVKKSESNLRPLSTGLMLDSVSSTAKAMISVSSTVVFFSALKAVLGKILPALSIGIPSVLIEITGFTRLTASDGMTLPIAAAILSFGGICVLMQIFSIVGGRFSLKKFLLSRLPAALLSAGYGFIILKILRKLGITCAAVTKIRLSESPSLIPVLCVFAMVAITLFSRRSSEE